MSLQQVQEGEEQQVELQLRCGQHAQLSAVDLGIPDETFWPRLSPHF